MAKSNFLLVNLNEKKTKKLAATITGDTSRNILNHLAEKEDSEANISKILGIPISTVHYHLQKLQEASLVVVEEFHYSKKGREVNHYKLANKYIIIAPKKVRGLKERLRGILPVGLAMLGVGFILGFLSKLTSKSEIMATSLKSFQQTDLAEKVVSESIGEITYLAAEQAPIITESTPLISEPASIFPELALSFFLGVLTVIFVYLIVKKIKKRKN